MSKKASPKHAHAKQKRLPPDDRRKEFVAKATEFFSEQGFDGGTRDLARRLGVTQPLLFARGGYGRFLGTDGVAAAPKP